MKPVAVILAAGKGARLDRHDRPKPLVHVGTEPMIARLIRQLQEAGVNEVLIVVGERGEEIKRELLGNPALSSHLTFIEQKDSSRGGLLESFLTASGVADGPVLISMSDVVFLENPFPALLKKASDASNSLYTLVGTNLEHGENSGARSRVRIEQQRVTDVGEALTAYQGIEAGVYLVPRGKAAGLREFSKQAGHSTLSDLARGLARNGDLGHLALDGDGWYDVNTPAIHIRANMRIRNAGQTSVPLKSSTALRTLPSFSQFSRTKHMVSDVIIERGAVRTLRNFDFISEKKKESSHFLITDSRVDALYGDLVLTELRAPGFNVTKFVVEEGEKSKNLSEFSRIADGIFSYGMDKNSTIISLGGGVVNNLAGVLASTLYRGIELMHIATSSMSQVDASLDFKQAINSNLGKNLIGSYYPASKILIDPEVLRTLDGRHLRNGIAESIKHGFTQDAAFVKRLAGYADKLDNSEVLEDIIRTTIELKIPLLNGNVQDDRNEMLPQYGHSVGHAVEHLSSYELLHGEAVAIGMCVSAEVAKLLGLADEETVATHYDVLRKFNLPTTIPVSMSAEDVLDVIRYDKHHVQGCPHMALPTKVGAMFNDRGVYSVPVEYEVLKRAICANQEKSLHG